MFGYRLLTKALASDGQLGNLTAESAAIVDDLSRDVYGLLGIPIDGTGIAEVVHAIEQATRSKTTFLVSTANLNFLVASQSDNSFRETLLSSDLCTPDGMPIVWLARILGIPIRARVAGSDLYEALKSKHAGLKVFFFGGDEGMAEKACQTLNAETCPMKCVGSLYPGFGTIDDMSTASVIDTINEADADFLAVALGAKKGQAWLYRNQNRLRAPVRIHLGAVINFQAGAINRAPLAMQRWGLEWLWRIKEEPHLWRRYWADGLILIRLLVGRVLPLVAIKKWHSITGRDAPLRIEADDAADLKSVTLNINGDATVEHVGTATFAFREALGAGQDIAINCAGMQFVDARFIGLLLMLDKQLKRKHRRLTFMKVPRRIEKIFRRSGFEFLLRS